MKDTFKSIVDMNIQPDEQYAEVFLDFILVSKFHILINYLMKKNLKKFKIGITDMII